jgi:hypothetical protein
MNTHLSPGLETYRVSSSPFSLISFVVVVNSRFPTPCRSIVPLSLLVPKNVVSKIKNIWYLKKNIPVAQETSTKSLGPSWFDALAVVVRRREETAIFRSQKTCVLGRWDEGWVHSEVTRDGTRFFFFCQVRSKSDWLRQHVTVEYFTQLRVDFLLCLPSSSFLHHHHHNEAFNEAQHWPQPPQRPPQRPLTTNHWNQAMLPAKTKMGPNDVSFGP